MAHNPSLRSWLKDKDFKKTALSKPGFKVPTGSTSSCILPCVNSFLISDNPPLAVHIKTMNSLHFVVFVISPSEDKTSPNYCNAQNLMAYAHWQPFKRLKSSKISESNTPLHAHTLRCQNKNKSTSAVTCTNDTVRLHSPHWQLLIARVLQSLTWTSPALFWTSVNSIYIYIYVYWQMYTFLKFLFVLIRPHYVHIKCAVISRLLALFISFTLFSSLILLPTFLPWYQKAPGTVLYQ